MYVWQANKRFRLIYHLQHFSFFLTKDFYCLLHFWGKKANDHCWKVLIKLKKVILPSSSIFSTFNFVLNVLENYFPFRLMVVRSLLNEQMSKWRDSLKLFRMLKVDSYLGHFNNIIFFSFLPEENRFLNQLKRKKLATYLKSGTRQQQRLSKLYYILKTLLYSSPLVHLSFM